MWPSRSFVTWYLPCCRGCLVLDHFNYSELLYFQRGNQTTVLVPVKHPWRIKANISHEFTAMFNINKTADTDRPHIHGLCCTLQWRHNGRDGASNHQSPDCLFKSLFRRRSKKTLKLRVTGICARNSPVTGEFPAQMSSNAENASISWRHYVRCVSRT